MSKGERRHEVEILLTSWVTHDVRRFVVEKPSNYKFTPGQATEVSIKRKGFEDRAHPFTFTSLPSDRVLEFTIKTYPVDENPKHKGVTEELSKLEVGDELIVGEPFGAIHYKGPGVFIAGGAGITPFISIFRDLKSKNKLSGNKLIFSNKTRRDVILEQELRAYFDKNDLMLTLTEDEVSVVEHGRVDKEFLKNKVSDYRQNFYVCGPWGMVEEINKILAKLGAGSSSLVFEK